DPTLHLLKQAGLEHLLLERFERGLDLVVEDGHPQFQRPRREEVDRSRTGAERSTTFISMRRIVPGATAGAPVGHPACDSATASTAAACTYTSRKRSLDENARPPGEKFVRHRSLRLVLPLSMTLSGTPGGGCQRRGLVRKGPTMNQRPRQTRLLWHKCVGAAR